MSQQSLFGREDLPSRRGRLLRRIRHLADGVLPRRARCTEESRDQDYPVQEDHCFRRIAYDAAAGKRWDEKVPKPFEKHATTRQLRKALEALGKMAQGASQAHELNRQSLRYRKERDG